jgi:hypothetical protein
MWYVVRTTLGRWSAAMLTMSGLLLLLAALEASNVAATGAGPTTPEYVALALCVGGGMAVLLAVVRRYRYQTQPALVAKRSLIAHSSHTTSTTSSVR